MISKIKVIRNLLKLFIGATIFFTWGAQAQIKTLKVTPGASGGIPIALSPFAGNKGLSENIRDIIASDLKRSGRFNPLPTADYLSLPSKVAQVQYKDWRLLNADALIIGSVQPRGGDQYQVQFRLLDVYGERQLVGNQYTVSGKQLRKVAHVIADLIYKTMTGIPGAFDTKIAYVQKTGQGKKSNYRLLVSDADAHGPQQILTSANSIMSPSWSPDNKRLAYAAVNNRQWKIYVHDIYAGTRKEIASFKRINGAPAWSPDGSKIAMSLSKDGNSEIYVKNLTSGALVRLTKNTAPDTEPSWSPNGREIVFASGRAGKPQIYSVSASGGSAKRVTFQGNSNSAPSYSPDGKNIVVITDAAGGDKVGLYNLQRRTVKTLTNTSVDDSPSFAPNGDMVLYSTVSKGRSTLAVVSANGGAPQLLNLQSGEVSHPAWSH